VAEFPHFLQRNVLQLPDDCHRGCCKKMYPAPVRNIRGASYGKMRESGQIVHHPECDGLSKSGTYKVRFYDLGTDPSGKKDDFVWIEVDELIPCKQPEWWEEGLSPIYCRPQGRALYAMILEKAFAKFANGRYSNLQGGYEMLAWMHITGETKQEWYSLRKSTDAGFEKTGKQFKQWATDSTKDPPAQQEREYEWPASTLAPNSKDEVVQRKVLSLISRRAQPTREQLKKWDQKPGYRKQRHFQDIKMNFLDSDRKTLEGFWETLVHANDNNYLMSASILSDTAVKGEEFRRTDGLVEGHAFSLLSLHVLKSNSEKEKKTLNPLSIFR
jgi:hypothetical protein